MGLSISPHIVEMDVLIIEKPGPETMSRVAHPVPSIRPNACGRGASDGRTRWERPRNKTCSDHQHENALLSRFPCSSIGAAPKWNRILL